MPSLELDLDSAGQFETSSTTGQFLLNACLFFYRKCFAALKTIIPLSYFGIEVFMTQVTVFQQECLLQYVLKSIESMVHKYAMQLLLLNSVPPM